MELLRESFWMGSTVIGGLLFSCPNDSPTSEQRINLEQAVMVAKEALENISRYVPLIGQLTSSVYSTNLLI
jgi:hypothetical protein